MSDKVVSPSGAYEMNLQDDGNLVVYRRTPSGGEPIWASGADPHPLPPPVQPPVPPPSTSLPMLRARGTTFINQETGLLWKWRGVSAFRLFDDYLHGRDIAPYCRWAQERRLNLLRVFGMYCGKLGRLVPSEVPDYFPRLNSFLGEVGTFGLCVEWVAFADMQTDPLRTIDPLGHYADLADVLLGRPGVVQEICNEPFVNGMEPTSVYHNYSELAQALGHYVPQDGTLPCAQFVTIHSPRDDEWPRKPGKNCLELSRLGWDGHPPLRVPCVEDEPMGIGPDEAGRRSMRVADHAQCHAAASLFGCGSTIHGDFGLETRLPTSAEDAIVQAVVESWDAVPPACQTWNYTAGHLADCPLADNGLRTYGMVQGDVAVMVRIRPTAGPVSQNGWRIISERGYQGCVVELVR